MTKPVTTFHEFSELRIGCRRIFSLTRNSISVSGCDFNSSEMAQHIASWYSSAVIPKVGAESIRINFSLFMRDDETFTIHFHGSSYRSAALSRRQRRATWNWINFPWKGENVSFVSPSLAHLILRSSGATCSSCSQLFHMKRKLQMKRQSCNSIYLHQKRSFRCFLFAFVRRLQLKCRAKLRWKFAWTSRKISEAF